MIEVKAGDVWAVGNNMLLCDDLLKRRPLGELTAEVAAGQVYAKLPDLIYCDPPYNRMQEAAYRSYAERGMPDFTGPDGKIGDWPAAELHRRLLQECTGVRHVFIEMGDNESVAFHEQCTAMGFNLLAGWRLSYRQGRRECWLNQLGAHGVEFLRLPAGIDHEQAPAIVIEQLTQPGQLVYDPLMGQGLTILAAHKLGRKACGVELVPAYVETVIERLVAAGAGDPVLMFRKE